MNQKIHLAGNYRLAEINAAGTITPGMALERTSAGTVQAHSTAGGFGERMFAQEDALQGRTVADNYVATDPVRIAFEVSGSRGLALLKAGTNYAIGTKLISNGDGTLKATTGSPLQIFATVDTAIDLSASGAVATLSPVTYQ